MTAPYTSELQGTACRLLAMYRLLRQGGTFLLELSDTSSPAAVGLLYLLAASFGEVALCKPVAVAPASHRRFAVCWGLRRRSPPFAAALALALPHLSPAIPLVEAATILQDNHFLDLLRRSNKMCARPLSHSVSLPFYVSLSSIFSLFSLFFSVSISHTHSLWTSRARALSLSHVLLFSLAALLTVAGFWSLK